ncbi:MAG: DUF885 domain-containing protein [Thermoanaerobaculia bacterium]|nr:DUF885 domain-containing protein [Thermoanaerobaculia bacterium]
MGSLLADANRVLSQTLMSSVGPSPGILRPVRVPGRPPWRRTLLLLAILLGSTGWRPHVFDHAASSNARADQLFDEYFEAYLELHPSRASSLGDHRFDDRLEITIGDRYRSQFAALAQSTLDAMAGLDPAHLTPDRKTSRDLLTYQLEQELELLSFPGHLLPISSMDHFPDEFATLGSGLGAHRFETPADFENFMLRVDDFTRWVDIAIERMREGVRRGYVLPKIVTEEVIRLTERQDVPSVRDSVFADPLKALPAELTWRQRRHLKKRYLDTIRDRILPTYRKLIHYLRTDYLPHCRDSVAWSALPDGVAWYRAWVAFWTSTDLTASEIHAIGRREVERISKEIAQLEAKSSDRGRVTYDTTAELLAAYDELTLRVEPRLEALFGPWKPTPLEIVPTHLVSHYRGGSDDGKRPGRFMLSVGNIAKYPHAVSPALYLHEAIPGHHFQHSVQSHSPHRETELPAFRRHTFESAYSEGWALYVEGFGHELGIYETPTDDRERLHSELFRAVRLVVDTGIHTQGWTAQQAIDYFQQHGGSSPWSEVIRYISLPGQALSYKLGELKILELRQRAEQALGPHFDIREFHRQILEPGPLPLALLERSVEEWIGLQLRASVGG